MTVPPTAVHVQGAMLACEGDDDEAFFIRMFDHLRIRGVQVRKYNGKPQLPTFLLGLRDSSEFETVRAVGIVRDADDNAPSAFQSVTDRLQRLTLHRPRRIGEFSSGQCDFDNITRSFGVYIMPDNQITGALEDLCLRAIDGDVSLPCVDEFLACVSGSASVQWRPQDRSKARLNAWLASRSDPTLLLGYAMNRNLIDRDHQAFGPIRAFLTQLAEAAGAPAQ